MCFGFLFNSHWRDSYVTPNPKRDISLDVLAASFTCMTIILHWPPTLLYLKLPSNFFLYKEQIVICSQAVLNGTPKLVFFSVNCRILSNLTKKTFAAFVYLAEKNNTSTLTRPSRCLFYAYSARAEKIYLLTGYRITATSQSFLIVLSWSGTRTVRQLTTVIQLRSEWQ